MEAIVIEKGIEIPLEVWAGSGKNLEERYLSSKTIITKNMKIAWTEYHNRE